MTPIGFEVVVELNVNMHIDILWRPWQFWFQKARLKFIFLGCLTCLLCPSVKQNCSLLVLHQWKKIPLSPFKITVPSKKDWIRRNNFAHSVSRPSILFVSPAVSLFLAEWRERKKFTSPRAFPGSSFTLLGGKKQRTSFILATDWGCAGLLARKLEQECCPAALRDAGPHLACQVPILWSRGDSATLERQEGRWGRDLWHLVEFQIVELPSLMRV